MTIGLISDLFKLKLQQEVKNMKEALNEIQMLDLELKQKDDLIKQLKATSNIKKIVTILNLSLNEFYSILY